MFPPSPQQQGYGGATVPAGAYPPQPGPPAPGPTQPPLQQQGSPGFGPPQQQAGNPPEAAPGTAPAPGGIKRFFSRKQDQTAAPGQTPSPGDPNPQQPAAPGTSPERKGFLGLFGRSNTAAATQQATTSPGQASPGMDPANAHQQPGVAVVPPPSGLCSKAPLPADEVARLQSAPVHPSKLGLLNRPPSRPGSPTAPGALGAAAAGPAVAAVDPAFHGPPPLEGSYGPYLRYGSYNPSNHVYSLSVMMIIHQSKSPMPPHLRYRDLHHRSSEVVLKTPVRLWSYAGYNFWRWDVVLQLGSTPATVEYCVVNSGDHFFSTHKKYHFQLPSANQKWHWGFHSCNGFDDPANEAANGGIQPMWRDVMHVHARDPIHVMFGGGDQLYCDDVWKLPSLVQWTCIADKPSRNSHPFSQAMVNESFDFYFRNYTHHFSNEVFKDALASIPQAMVWDDHDIFDGWGSYPHELQNCPVFSGIYYVARKFYLLFQCHAAEDNHRQLNKGWGLTGLSWTAMVGSTTAVIGLDSRGERTIEQIIRPASWAAFQDQVAKLPAGVRHVVIMATVPTIYPSVPGVEDAMMALAGTGIMVNALTAFLQKTGLSDHLFNMFGEPELLDDLLDHWSADVHEVEKFCLIRMMQDLALARGFRFTILSGDVHCAGLGMFQTFPKQNLKTDHRYMQQIISSAIGNVPPPDPVIKALCASNKAKMLDAYTREKMRGIFENGLLLKAARNWCDVHERPLLTGPAAAAATLAGGVSGGAADGSLQFQLRVEHPTYKEVRPLLYDIMVPVLELPPGSFSQGPLPVAPPLPQPLMIKFQAELVAAGVGIDAAMPLSGAQEEQTQMAAHQAASAVSQGQMAGQQQQEQQQAAAAAQMASLSLGAGVGAEVAAAQQQQQHYQQQQPQQQLSAGQQQDFGLTSDVNQHAQQQLQQQAAHGAPAEGAYPAVPGGPPSNLPPVQPHGQPPPPGAPLGQAPLQPLQSQQQQQPFPYAGAAAAQAPYGSYGGAPPVGAAPGPHYPYPASAPPGEAAYPPQPNAYPAGYGSQPPPAGYGSPPVPYGGPPPQQPYGAPPQQPYGASQQQPYGAPPQQPFGAPPQQPYGAPPQQPYGAPPQQPYGAPPQQPYGAPPQQPYGAPPQQPYGTPPQQPYGAPPQQPYGAPPQQPYGAPPQQPYGYQ